MDLYQTYQLKINERFFEIEKPQRKCSFEGLSEQESVILRNITNLQKSGLNKSKSTKKNSLSPVRVLKENMNSHFENPSNVIESQFIADEVEMNPPAPRNGITSIVGSTSQLPQQMVSQKLKPNTFNCFYVNSLNFDRDAILVPKSCSNMQDPVPDFNNKENRSQNYVESYQSLQQHKQKVVIDNDNCFFCKGNFIFNDMIAKTSKCGHLFHKGCFDGFLEGAQRLSDL